MPQKRSVRVKNAQRTIVDGIEFPSRSEAYYYSCLRDMKAKGEIFDFMRQIPFELQPQFRKCPTLECKYRMEKPEENSRDLKRYKDIRKCPLCGAPLELVREITYVADFVVIDKYDGIQRTHVQDVKSSPFFQTDIFKLKKRLFDYKYPMYQLELVFPKIPRGWKGDEKSLLTVTS